VADMDDFTSHLVLLVMFGVPFLLAVAYVKYLVADPILISANAATGTGTCTGTSTVEGSSKGSSNSSSDVAGVNPVSHRIAAAIESTARFSALLKEHQELHARGELPERPASLVGRFWDALFGWHGFPTDKYQEKERRRQAWEIRRRMQQQQLQQQEEKDRQARQRSAADAAATAEVPTSTSASAKSLFLSLSASQPSSHSTAPLSSSARDHSEGSNSGAVDIAATVRALQQRLEELEAAQKHQQQQEEQLQSRVDQAPQQQQEQQQQ
jgi:hypothetical protein